MKTRKVILVLLLFSFGLISIIVAQQPPLPTVTTLFPESIDENSAVLKGRVNPNGTPTYVNFESCWGATNYFYPTPLQDAGDGNSDVIVSRKLTGLIYGKTYTYMVVAHAEGRVISGDCVSFVVQVTSLNEELTQKDQIATESSPTLVRSIRTKKTRDSTKLQESELLSKYQESYKDFSITRYYSLILLIVLVSCILFYNIKKSDSKKLRKIIKIYIVLIMMPMYYLFFYILIGFTNSPNILVLRTDKILGTISFIHAAINGFICLMFLIYIEDEEEYTKLEQENLSINNLMSYYGRFYGPVLKLCTSGACAMIFLCKIEHECGFNDVIASLLFDVLFSILFLSYIFHDWRLWTKFFNSLERNLKANLLSYLFLILSVVFFLKSLQISEVFFSATFFLAAAILTLLAPLIYVIRKVDFRLRKSEALEIFLILVVSVSVPTYGFLGGSQYWIEKPELILVFVLSLVMLLIFFSIVGIMIYYVFSHPWTILICFFVLHRIIRFWNFVQLRKTTKKSKFYLSYEEDQRPVGLQLFLHFFSELFIIYILLSAASLANVESLSSILEPKVLLWNNRLFFYILPAFAFIFSLSVAGFKWNQKILNASIFHKFLSITTLLIFLLGVYTGKLELEIISYTIQIYLLFISGISFAFLVLAKYSAERADEFFSLKRRKYHFLEIQQIEEPRLQQEISNQETAVLSLLQREEIGFRLKTEGAHIFLHGLYLGQESLVLVFKKNENQKTLEGISAEILGDLPPEIERRLRRFAGNLLKEKFPGYSIEGSNLL